MSAHKEQVLDESRLHARFGATCVTGFSSVIQPSHYPDGFEDFFAAVQDTWQDMWVQVFSADLAGE